MHIFSLALFCDFIFVWFGLVRIISSSMTSSEQLQQNETVKAFVAELLLNPQDADKAIKTLDANIEALNETSIIASNYTDTLRASLACQIAKLVFGKDGQYTDASFNAIYVNQTEVNWSETCWLRPNCLVTPSSTAGVALALKIVRFLQIQFAIRAGGHNPNSGFASVGTQGLLLDLSSLNQRRLSADKKIASIGPGNRWIDVYEYLDSANVTVIGGRVPEVGVGGYMLGGGLSHFSSQFGLACDNVANYEVVLADSTIVNANATEHPDLFYSLRGGGPNYGVVTRFDLETVQYNQENQVWYEVRKYPTSQIKTLLRALVEYQAAAAEDPKAGLVFVTSQNTSTVGFIYLEPKARPSVFSSFYSIEGFSTAVPSTIGTPVQLAQIFTSAAPPANYDIVSQASGVKLEFYEQAYTRYDDISSAILNTTGAVMSFVIQPVTKNGVLQSQKNGGNPIGLRAQEQQLFSGTITWADEADTEAAHKAVKSLGEAVVELARANGVYLPTVYQNDANYDQSPLGSFPAPNLARLKAASLKYDPDQIFQNLQNDGFLLSKV